MRRIETQLIDEAAEALVGDAGTLPAENIEKARACLARLRLQLHGRAKRVQARKTVSTLAFDYRAGRWGGVTETLRGQWEEAFPCVDIDKELAAMRRWLLGPPTRKKGNLHRFAWQWLARHEPWARIQKERAEAGLHPIDPFPQGTALDAESPGSLRPA